MEANVGALRGQLAADIAGRASTAITTPTSYTTSRDTPCKHRADFCLSFDDKLGPNPWVIVTKLIPRCRCACARDVGSRSDNKAAVYLHEQWLPRSGESLGDLPIFFYYVNVGPNVREEDMITDVYLPLK